MARIPCLAEAFPANGEAIKAVLQAPETDDGRSPWLWFQTAGGDLILGCFPRGDGFLAVEGHVTDDWQAATKAGAVRYVIATNGLPTVEYGEPGKPPSNLRWPEDD